MRLACYGWVDEHAGSVASANHLVLRELLRRGVEVDFFANRDHVPPPRGLADGFRYVGVRPPRPLGALPPLAQRGVNWLFSPAVRAAWRRIFQPVAERRHREAPFDALLSLGTPPAFTIPGVPTVTWVQGPLQTELQAIRRLEPQIRRTSGRLCHRALIGYYRVDERSQNGVLDSSDRVICGSRWARSALVASGIDASRVSALPYPIDLRRFTAGGEIADLNAPLVLSLGRLDPRKRLDLLLDGFGRVLDVLPDARLLAVGRPGYAPRQLRLLERFARRDRVEYRPAVPREQVPALLREAAVLVQTSENENFGSAVAEALACGVPAVVGPSNGTADYLDETSQVFRSYDADAVAEAVERVIRTRRSDPEGSRRSARATAERWFAPAQVTERLLAIIDDAVRPRPDSLPSVDAR